MYLKFTTTLTIISAVAITIIRSNVSNVSQTCNVESNKKLNCHLAFDANLNVNFDSDQV